MKYQLRLSGELPFKFVRDFVFEFTTLHVDQISTFTFDLTDSCA